MTALVIATVSVDGRTFADAEAAFGALASSVETAADRATPGIAAALRSALVRSVDRMQELHGNPWSGLGAGNRALFSRTGQGLRELARSLTVVHAAQLASVAGSVTLGEHLAAHETGATISARGGWLTIPMPAAMDSHGVALRARAGDWSDTFVKQSRNGGGMFIFQRTPSGPVPLYMLRKTVSVPARLRYLESLDAELNPFEAKAADEFAAAVGRLI